MSRRRAWARVLVGCVGLALVGSHPPVLNGLQDLTTPGAESRDRALLDPVFAQGLAALEAGMAARGWPVWLRAGHRDDARQAWYLQRGHSQTRRSRHLAGEAADLLLPVPWVLFPLHIAFFHALREEARAAGLCAGGDWSRRGWPWAPFGLGWDPAHVERCGP